MIRVTCESCGKVVRAKDEHAGRRARCPGCGEALVIPDAGGEVEAPAAAPRAPEPGARRGAGGGRRPRVRRGARGTSRGARARRGGRASGTGVPSWITPVAIGVVLLAAAVLVMQAFAERPAYETALERGTDLLNEARYVEARDAFAEIPEGHQHHEIAQQKIAELEGLIAADRARTSRRDADRLYHLVMALRDNHVESVGTNHPCYAGNARYMLKRAREFIDRFGDDVRATELKGLFSMYRNVASLDEPMTGQDMRCEVALRMSVRDFSAALDVLEEYAALPGADAEVVPDVRAEIERNAKIFWNEFRSDMEEEVLIPGEENWTAVVNRITNRFLPRVEGLGTDVTAEAQALLERARRGG